MKSVSLSEIYRVIAGHSNYHGDSILAAFTCIAEGKEVSPIKPIETVEPVRGEWIYTPTYREYECSNCKSMINLSDDANAHLNFCPQCGADMRKKVE